MIGPTTTAPVEPEAHTVEPSEPWYHPHHIMHHGGKIFGSICLLLIAFIGMDRWKHHRKSKT